MSFGLPQKAVEGIRRVLADHPEVDKAMLYGSRAKGNYRKGSDIDLALQGKGLDLQKLSRISSELDDLLLPYEIDVSIMHDIDNDALIEHIERVGVEFYRK